MRLLSEPLSTFDERVREEESMGGGTVAAITERDGLMADSPT